MVFAFGEQWKIENETTTKGCNIQKWKKKKKKFPLYSRGAWERNSFLLQPALTLIYSLHLESASISVLLSCCPEVNLSVI